MWTPPQPRHARINEFEWLLDLLVGVGLNPLAELADHKRSRSRFSDLICCKCKSKRFCCTVDVISREKLRACQRQKLSSGARLLFPPPGILWNRLSSGGPNSYAAVYADLEAMRRRGKASSGWKLPNRKKAPKKNRGPACKPYMGAFQIRDPYINPKW